MIHNTFHCFYPLITYKVVSFLTMPNNAPGLCIFSTFTFQMKIKNTSNLTRIRLRIPCSNPKHTRQGF